LKIDPHKHKEKYQNWKKKGVVEGVSKFNSDILIEYLTDMENGLNVTRRGVIGYARLNNLRQRMRFIARHLEELYGKGRIIDVIEKEIVAFFKAMRDGKILTREGKNYTSIPDYVNVFKAFWHWYQRVENEKGNLVKDITRYIDTSPVKESEFVYFTIEDVKKIAERAKYEYRVLMWFLFDSGIRAPTELMNVKVSDLALLEGSDIYQLNIRDEISKTFGRKIKLMLCSHLLRDYIQDKGLGDEDYLFPIVPRVVSQYLKRLVVRTLGDKKTKGGQFLREISMYDFRHSSACYWLLRYKSESGLKYRFGWKKEAMVHYYTKLLGMRDTIAEDDLMIDSEAKTKLEKELGQERKNKSLLEEELQSQREEMTAIKEQLERNKAGNLFILKLLKSLQKRKKIQDVIEVIKEEDLVEELEMIG
jgi:integrase|tara:strand:+ start:88 stop:1344 length:1257 start_codon:yes stop_codon:yes gene_type:complete